MRTFTPFFILVFVVLAAIYGICGFYIINPGHVGVEVLGGDVVDQHEQGWGFANPLSNIIEFDCRDKTMDFTAITIRSQDQLETHFDISVQYNAIPSMASQMFAETGNVDAVLTTHMVPKFRNAARDSGRTIEDSKSFFNEATQSRMTSDMLTAMQEFCTPKGIQVTDVLIRAIDPPDFINDAVQRREEREQETERQRAELERFKIEQEQKVASATAERDAAMLKAEQIRELAAAEADAVALRGEAIAANPLVLRLEYIQAWDGVLPRMMMGGENVELLLPVSSE